MSTHSLAFLQRMSEPQKQEPDNWFRLKGNKTWQLHAGPSQNLGPGNVLSWLLLKHLANGVAGKCHGIDANFPDFDNWLHNRTPLKHLGIEAWALQCTPSSSEKSTCEHRLWAPLDFLYIHIQNDQLSQNVSVWIWVKGKWHFKNYFPTFLEAWNYFKIQLKLNLIV